MKDIIFKKTISTLAVAAGVAMGVAGNAHAQTITGTSVNGQQYVVDMALYLSPPAYTYNYIATLSSIAPNVTVDSFAFQFQEDVQFRGVTGGFSLDPTSVKTGSLFMFTSPTGLAAIGDGATFSFYSPDPPNGSVGVATTGPGSSGAAPSFGPLPCICPAVPEPAPLALLGLGSLPLAFAARRRMARK